VRSNEIHFNKYIGVVEDIIVVNNKYSKLIIDSSSENFLLSFEGNDLSEENQIEYFLLEKIIDNREKKRLGISIGSWVSLEISNEYSGSGSDVTTFSLSSNQQEQSELISFESRNINLATNEQISLFDKIWRPFESNVTFEKSEFYVDKIFHSVAVYDVGQGLFTALVDEHEHPLAYVDIGYPIAAKRKFLPKLNNFNPFYYCDRKPIILTHLDWDHWGFAIISGLASKSKKTGTWKTHPNYKKNVIENDWFLRAPDHVRHSLGPSHVHLLYEISKSKNSSLNLLPHHFNEMKIGNLLILETSSKNKNPTSSYLRNNEALTASLISYEDEDEAILICGDAEFRSINFTKNLKYVGIVAPHHGGKMDLSYFPQPFSINPIMAISSGYYEYNNIPDQEFLLESYKKGWGVYGTFLKKICNRCGGLKNHISLNFGYKPECGCYMAESNNICLN